MFRSACAYLLTLFSKHNRYKFCLATDTRDGYDHCEGEHHVGAIDGTIAGTRKMIIASVMLT